MWHDHTLLWAGCVCVCACLSGKRLKRRKTLEPGILYNDINLIYHIASGVETPAFFPPPTKLATYGENISSGRRADVPAGRRWGTWALIRRSGWPPSSHRYNISPIPSIMSSLKLWSVKYIYIYTYIYVCVFTCLIMFMFTFIYTYIDIHLHLYWFANICIYMFFLRVCVCICICIYIYILGICRYMCIYIYI